MLIDWNIAEEKTLRYDYSIDAGRREINSIEARFIMVHEGYALIFQGQIIDEEIMIELPPLTKVLNMVPKNKSKLKYRLELIFNNNEITIPDTGMIIIESKPVIRTSKPRAIKENKTIKIEEEIKIKPKTAFQQGFECFVEKK